MASGVTLILKQRSEPVVYKLSDATIIKDFGLYVSSGTPKGGTYTLDKKQGLFVVDFREVQLIAMEV